jgi:hypothetical protein
MTTQLHLIRFYAEPESTGLNPDSDVVRALERRDMYGVDGKYIPNQTFNDGDWLWFEAKLSFIPALGMSIGDIHASGFKWTEDTNPMVKTIEYNLKTNFFIVEVSWGLFNQLEITRQLNSIQNQ